MKSNLQTPVFSRRRLLKGGLSFGATVLAGGCESAAVRYEDVVRGDAQPQNYLEYLQEDIELLKCAQEEGSVQGVYYNPDKYALADIFQQRVAKIGLSLSLSDTLLQVAQALAAKEVGAFTTATDPTGRMRLASPIIIWPEAFNRPFVKTDDDFRNCMRHETVHAKDGYFGVLFNQTPLDLTTLNRSFRSSLKELRAVDADIEYILSHPTKNFSAEYMSDCCFLWTQKNERLIPTNDLEQQIANQQRELLSVSVIFTGKNFETTYQGTNRSIPYISLKLDGTH